MKKIINDIKELIDMINTYGDMIVSKTAENYITVMDMEEYKNRDIIQNLKQSEEEITKGEGIEADLAFWELMDKYANR